MFNRIRMLAYNKLITANWPPKLIYTPDALTEPHFPKVMWGFNHGSHIDLEQQYVMRSPIWLFWQSRRSPHALPSALIGDFSYTQHPMGALGLLHQAQEDFLPEHNFIEDVHKTESHNRETALQKLAAQRGTSLHQETVSYWLLPLFLHEIPQRILFGHPLYRSVTLDTHIWRMNPD